MNRLGVAVVSLVLATSSLAAADWPHWRGPLASGVSTETGLPERWSATQNVAWKAPLAGVGVSSPIVAGDQVYVTSQVGAGVRQPGTHPRLAQGGSAAGAGERALTAAGAAGKTYFVVQAFARADGRLLWEHRMEAVGELPGVHDKHNMASSSPVSDGRMVYAWFATGQIVALDRAGKLVWSRHLGQEISPFDINWGHSSSPTLHGDSAAAAVRSRARVVPAGREQGDRQAGVEGGSRQGPRLVQHPDRGGRQRPQRGHRQFQRTRGCL